MESYKDAIAFTDYAFTRHASYYVVKYNEANSSVTVQPFGALSFRSGADIYNNSEGSNLNAVFVEVDSVKELKEAYPNYFLDVELFAQKAKAAVGGSGPYDLSFLRGWRRRQ